MCNSETTRRDIKKQEIQGLTPRDTHQYRLSNLEQNQHVVTLSVNLNRSTDMRASLKKDDRDMKLSNRRIA